MNLIEARKYVHFPYNLLHSVEIGKTEIVKTSEETCKMYVNITRKDRLLMKILRWLAK